MLPNRLKTAPALIFDIEVVGWGFCITIIVSRKEFPYIFNIKVAQIADCSLRD
jgi:hypothetical protein